MILDTISSSPCCLSIESDSNYTYKYILYAHSYLSFKFLCIRKVSLIHHSVSDKFNEKLLRIIFQNFFKNTHIVF